MRAWVEAVAEAEVESEDCVEEAVADDDVGEAAAYRQLM